MLRTTKTYAFEELDDLLGVDHEHPHIHRVDMPYRIASIWQDHGCEIGIWEKDSQVIAWAVFQPAWWNLDFVVCPAYRGSILEQEIFMWGKEQMFMYSDHTGEAFRGSVELFEDTPHAAQTIRNLEAVGFTPFDWSITRFELHLSQEITPEELPKGYKIRLFRGESEVQEYVALHRAAFGSERMTIAWRKRILQQPGYHPEIDLILENEAHAPVGFCICWMRGDRGQIEPLGVHPDYQRKGLGRALEKAACRALRAQGVGVINVDHGRYHEHAIALSQKTGFRKSNNALRYYVDVRRPGEGG